jgi:formylglycine-generating enzyme required for sulfatase activity
MRDLRHHRWLQAGLVVAVAAFAAWLFRSRETRQDTPPLPDLVMPSHGVREASPSTNTQPEAASRTKEISKQIKAPEWTNSLGMRFVTIPGSTLLYSIWLTRVRDFEAFVTNTGYDATKGMYSLQRDFWVQLGDTWKSPGFEQTPTHPVCGVSWEDARTFCAWLSRREGKLYRLPTDLEWSRAVGLPSELGDTPEKRKDGVKDVYPWGTQWPPPPGAGNYADSTLRDQDPDAKIIPGYHDGFAATSPVGSFAANPYGIHDLGGNVWEWCVDWFNEKQRTRALRGGSWYSYDAGGLWSSDRFNLDPATRSSRCGFRVVMEEKPPQ